MKGGQERRGGIIITQPSSEKEAKMLKKKKGTSSHRFSFYPPLFENRASDFISGDRRGADIRKKEKKREAASLLYQPLPLRLFIESASKSRQPANQPASQWIIKFYGRTT